MATVIENKKNGKTVSFKFRAHLGRNEIGKQINKYKTWFAPENLTPAKALKLAEKTAEEWEQTVKEEYEKDKSDPLRVKEISLSWQNSKWTGLFFKIKKPVKSCSPKIKNL